MTTKIKEDDAPCSEAKEENNTSASHAPCSEAKEENKTTASHMVIIVVIFYIPWLLSLSSHKSIIVQVSADKESDNNYKGDSACLSGVSSSGGVTVEVGKDACTPNPTLQKRVTSTNSKKQQTAKKTAMNTKSKLQSSAIKSNAGTPNLAQENQAIKRQKLEGGKTRQVILQFLFAV